MMTENLMALGCESLSFHTAWNMALREIHRNREGSTPAEQSHAQTQDATGSHPEIQPSFRAVKQNESGPANGWLIAKTPSVFCDLPRSFVANEPRFGRPGFLSREKAQNAQKQTERQANATAGCRSSRS